MSLLRRSKVSKLSFHAPGIEYNGIAQHSYITQEEETLHEVARASVEGCSPRCDTSFFIPVSGI